MKKPILVTGAHRSGSTWTGKIIAAANNVRYIHEPLNIGISRKNSPITFWYEYMSGNEGTVKQQEYVKYIESFDSPFHFEQIKRLKDVGSIGDLYQYFSNLNGRLLIKDPLALMSAEWFYKNLQSDVIITIRHPAAFVASLKMKNWQFDFENFLNQEKLMQTYLAKYKVDIKDYTLNRPDIIKQGILVWNILYSTVQQYSNMYKDKWYFVKHEDLSMDPQREFKKIFDFLDLKFDSKIKELINRTTTSKTTSKLERDAKSNVKNWKNRLTDGEILEIKQGTESVWKEFYTEDDW